MKELARLRGKLGELEQDIQLLRHRVEEAAEEAARAAARAQDARYHSDERPSNLLTLEDIDRALEAFPSYHSLHVFESTVFAGRMQAPGLTRQGVCIFRRAGEKPPSAGSVLPILAMLVGDYIGDPAERNRRIFPLQFDTRTREWTAYDGGLVSWMKEGML